MCCAIIAYVLSFNRSYYDTDAILNNVITHPNQILSAVTGIMWVLIWYTVDLYPSSIGVRKYVRWILPIMKVRSVENI